MGGEKQIKAGDIANFLSAEIIGNAERLIHRPANIHSACEDNLTYCYFKTSDQEVREISATKAGVVICSRNLKKRLEHLGPLNQNYPVLIFTENPKLSFSKVLLRFFVKQFVGPRISSLAVIETDSKIAKSASIGPGCYIGHFVEVGRNTIIHPNVTVYDQSILGERVVLNSGAVIGDEGLEYSRDGGGRLIKTPHIDKVIIGNNVEVGSNTAIHRGVLQSTIICEGTKIGSNINIGHEVNIGKHCIIGPMTVISGSVKIGNFTYIAPGVTITNSVSIGEHAFIGIGTLVLDDVPDKTTVVGHPGEDFKTYKRNRAFLKTLPLTLEKLRVGEIKN